MRSRHPRFVHWRQLSPRVCSYIATKRWPSWAKRSPPPRRYAVTGSNERLRLVLLTCSGFNRYTNAATQRRLSKLGTDALLLHRTGHAGKDRASGAAH